MPEYIPETPINSSSIQPPDSLTKLLHLPYQKLCEDLKKSALNIKETVVKETWGRGGKRVQDYTIYTGVLGTAYLLFKAYQVTNNNTDLCSSLDIVKACDSASRGSNFGVCKSFGTETLPQLMAMPSKWDSRIPSRKPKITVILNHFKRRTLCAQLDSLLHQTIPFHHAWVLAFGSPNELSLKRIVQTYNDTRISFVGSSHDFKYFGRFQLALQTESDLVYILDDGMIPGKKMLQILSHVAGTDKYMNSVLGSIGRILPFRQKDFTFLSYRKFRQ